MADEAARRSGRPLDQRGDAGPQRHALGGGTAPGPLDCNKCRATGKSSWPTTAPQTALARVWSGGPSASLASVWWTRPRVPARERLATSASDRPVAECWPSVTPTTLCNRDGWRACWRRWPMRTWLPACSTSDPCRVGRHRIPIPAATRQMGFLPFALGANLAVRRDAFEAVNGFCETLSAGEDIDLSWRLQLAGYRFAVGDRAVVAKRERTGAREAFRATWVYGRCDTAALPALPCPGHAARSPGSGEGVGLVGRRQPRTGHTVAAPQWMRALRRTQSGAWPDQ